MAVKLYEHQVADLEAMRKRNSFALWHEVGAGKTYPCVMRTLEVLHAHEGTMAVIVTEPSLIPQLEENFHEVVDTSGVHVEIGTVSGKSKDSQRQWILKDPPQVLIVNYEFFPKIAEWLYERARCGKVAVMWCDEAQHLKGFRGFRSKHGLRAKDIQRVASSVPVRLATSGSPVVNPNSPDIWGIYHYLDPSIFGPTLWKFEQEFFYDVSQSKQYKKLILRQAMKEEMSRRMYLCARRILKSDLPVDFPERVTIKHLVDMPPDTFRAYKELEEQAITQVAGETVTRPMLLARLMALQQIASGFLIHRDETNPDGEPKIIRLDSSHKDNAVRSILENVGPDASVLIWAVFTHEIDHLCRLVREVRGEDPARVDGQVVGDERKDAIKAFQAGKIKTFVAHPASAGAGLNLQIAGYAIRFSRSYRPIEYIQTRGRNQRVGKQFHKSITDFEVITNYSTDLKIASVLEKNLDLSSEITLDFLGATERNK